MGFSALANGKSTFFLSAWEKNTKTKKKKKNKNNKKKNKKKKITTQKII